MRSGNRRIVLPCYWRPWFCCLQQSISLSCFKQCSYESTTRPFLHSVTFFQSLVSYSTLSEQKIHFHKFSKALRMHATESYFFCLCGRGNTFKDALLFTDLFWFFNYCHSSLLLDGLSLHFSQGIFFLFLSVHLTFFFALFWVANFVVLYPIKTLSLLAKVVVTSACRFAKKKIEKFTKVCKFIPYSKIGIVRHKMFWCVFVW